MLRRAARPRARQRRLIPRRPAVRSQASEPRGRVEKRRSRFAVLGCPCLKSSRLPLEATTTVKAPILALPLVTRASHPVCRAALPDGGVARPGEACHALAFPARFRLIARADEGQVSTGDGVIWAGL